MCLAYLELDGSEELMKMCKEVQSGDRTHVEAKAAAFYFKSLYGLGFSRGNDHIINAALNYGYAIVRGLIARSIVCYGLEPSIGVFHHSELNNFNLADDMIDQMRENHSGYRIAGDLTVTDTIMEKSFWVGVYPGMTDEMLDYMAKTMIEAVEE